MPQGAPARGEGAGAAGAPECARLLALPPRATVRTVCLAANPPPPTPGLQPLGVRRYLKLVVLATHPDAHGRRLGTRIMEAITARADEEGVHVRARAPQALRAACCAAAVAGGACGLLGAAVARAAAAAASGGALTLLPPFPGMQHAPQIFLEAAPNGISSWYRDAHGFEQVGAAKLEFPNSPYSFELPLMLRRPRGGGTSQGGGSS